MGRQYTPEELHQIQALVEQGQTNREIAKRLSRPEAGIRNIRHRLKLKTKTKYSLNSLQQEKKTLQRQVSELGLKVASLQSRRQDISKALQL